MNIFLAAVNPKSNFGSTPNIAPLRLITREIFIVRSRELDMLKMTEIFT